MKKFIYKYCVPLSCIWFGFIFLLCATPGQFVPSVSFLELLSFDKWVHASVFFILCSLFLISAIKNHSSIYMMLLLFLFAVVYGGALEMMQAKVFSNRSADWQDFVANTFGCCMALLLLKKYKRLFFTPAPKNF